MTLKDLLKRFTLNGTFAVAVRFGSEAIKLAREVSDLKYEREQLYASHRRVSQEVEELKAKKKKLKAKVERMELAIKNAENTTLTPDFWLHHRYGDKDKNDIHDYWQ